MNKWIIGAIIGIAAVAAVVVGVIEHNSSQVSFGAVGVKLIEQYDPYVKYNGGIATQLPLKLGASGTAVNSIIYGTCNPTEVGTSLAATSTATFICSVPGVTAGSNVIGDLPSTAANTAGAFVLVNAYATTSGAIGFTILNLTGAATSSFSQATTSVEYLVHQ